MIILAIRTGEDTIQQVLDAEELDLLTEVIGDIDSEKSAQIRRAVVGDVGEADSLAIGEGRDAVLTEVVLLPGTWLSGRRFGITDFQCRYDSTVFAVRRGSEVIRQRIRDIQL